MGREQGPTASHRTSPGRQRPSRLLDGSDQTRTVFVTAVQFRELQHRVVHRAPERHSYYDPTNDPARHCTDSGNDGADRGADGRAQAGSAGLSEQLPRCGLDQRLRAKLDHPVREELRGDFSADRGAEG